MGVQLVDQKDGSVHVKELEDGEIAVITSWGGNLNHHVGEIVQRYGNHLVTIGQKHGDSWPNLFSSDHSFDNCRVRILPNGTKLEIKDNE